MSGAERFTCAGAGFERVGCGRSGEVGWEVAGSSTPSGTTEDARLLFPYTPEPMKTLENDTFPSAKLGDTATSGKKHE